VCIKINLNSNGSGWEADYVSFVMKMMHVVPEDLGGESTSSLLEFIILSWKTQWI